MAKGDYGRVSPISYVQRREAELRAEMVYLGFVSVWSNIANAMTVKREADYWTEEFAKLRAKYVRRGRKAGTKIVKKPEGQEVQRTKETQNEQEQISDVVKL